MGKDETFVEEEETFVEEDEPFVEEDEPEAILVLDAYPTPEAYP